MGAREILAWLFSQEIIWRKDPKGLFSAVTLVRVAYPPCIYVYIHIYSSIYLFIHL